MKFEDLRIGQTFTTRQEVSSETVELFGELSGDRNPIHFNDAYAEQSIFKGKIIHGMIIGALFSKVIATDFPGPGSIYLNQELSFKRPIYHNSIVDISVEVIELKPEKRIVSLKTACTVEGKLMVDGQAIVKLLPSV